jgi:hypothetical protein
MQKGWENTTPSPFPLFPFDQSNAQGPKTKNLAFNNFFYFSPNKDLQILTPLKFHQFSLHPRRFALLGKRLFMKRPEKSQSKTWRYLS